MVMTSDGEIPRALVVSFSGKLGIEGSSARTT